MRDSRSTNGLGDASPTGRDRGRCRVYPVFLPQWGCPHRCVYCNQRATGPGAGAAVAREGGLAAVEDRIAGMAREARLHGIPGEIAFYGGTFTALPLTWLERILCVAGAFVEEGVFGGIRFSTRPDALGPEVCRLMDRYPVRTVELGVQSLSDDVLQRSRRGYGAGVVREAARRIREKGWSLGLQLMPGLPGDNLARFMESLRGAMELAPDFVRIYPVLVLRETELADWLSTGKYVPLTLDEAVEWSAAAVELLRGAGISVIRMGLHPDPELLRPGVLLGGPFHPAFGYLVRVRRWRDRIDRWCAGLEWGFRGEGVVLRVPREMVSEVLGPGRENPTHWLIRWGFADLRIESVHGWSPDRFELRPQDENAVRPSLGILQDDDARRKHEKG